MAMVEPVPRNSPLLKVLPEIFQVAAETSTPLQALIAVAEDMHGPVRDVLDRIHTVPDPGRSPSSFIPFLSRWVDLDWLTLPSPESVDSAAAGVPVARQRDLIACAASLSARRGTVDGLTRFLQLATGPGGRRRIRPGRVPHQGSGTRGRRWASGAGPQDREGHQARPRNGRGRGGGHMNGPVP
ncbi:conserved hypothetical protein [Arthrobacter sp. Hiyo1]|nr:conserved hypothetical protein [Arthrobacter sp. Hiyo1]